MAEVRIFNPASYTPRSYFAGEGLGRRKTMARHHRRHHRRRHNPFGLNAGVVKDAAYNAAGALGALWLSSLSSFASFSSGWAGVGLTGAAAVAVSFGGKFVGGPRASEELLKGGLTATIIKAIHQAGMFTSIGLGSYGASWFGVPTASNQYLRAYPGNMPGRQGAGTVIVGGVPMLPAAGVSGLGYHRFRSRYAGNYGGM
jgi:hypothetical protein